MTETKTADAFDETVQEQLEQLSYWSHGAHVEIEVTEVTQHDLKDDRVRVTFDPPAGDAFTETMVVPKDPSHETEFTALLRTLGRNYDTAQDIIGERVPANYTDDGWEIDYDEPERSLKERAVDALDLYDFYVACSVGVTLFGFPLLFPVSMIIHHVSDDLDGLDIEDAVFGYVMGSVLWFLIVGQLFLSLI